MLGCAEGVKWGGGRQLKVPEVNTCLPVSSLPRKLRKKPQPQDQETGAGLKLRIAVVIPAYNPTEQLVGLIRELAQSDISPIIVVNDGSGARYDPIFEEIGSTKDLVIVRHAVNLGKGAALKAGLNFVYCNFDGCIGVVTADADGQHLVKDIVKVSQTLKEHPRALVLGSRSFGEKVPFRSLVGNKLTKYLFWLLVGKKLTDTQSGLRGIPMEFIPKLLKMKSQGYDFELDMLLACKYGNREIIEEEIQTVYVDGNISSHFNPLIDSMKIYFTLFRFMLASLATAIFDYIVFFAVYGSWSNILLSQSVARLAALGFNYLAVRKIVFLSNKQHYQVFPKYLILVLVCGLVSYSMINLLISVFPVNLAVAKLLSELLIYFGNFAVQRELIFRDRGEKTETDWDAYYKSLYLTASYTRRITTATLIRLIRQYVPNGVRGIRIVELGGGGSCFFETIKKKINPCEYHIVDNNEFGLDQLRSRIGHDTSVFLYNQDVLDLELTRKMDLVFSIGLIEHFRTAETKKAIEAHFKLLEPGGICIMSFPTPTWLYRITRGISESLGLWIFHDERPLALEEVEGAIADKDTIVFKKIIWPIILTQYVVVVRKGGTGD